MKQTPISSFLNSGWSLRACSLAMAAAISMGGSMSRMFSLRLGKRRAMSLTMAGQAELMTGLGPFLSFRYCLVLAVTSSAPLETSKTSSKPMSRSPCSTKSTSSRLLNWA